MEKVENLKKCGDFSVKFKFLPESWNIFGVEGREN